MGNKVPATWIGLILVAVFVTTPLFASFKVDVTTRPGLAEVKKAIIVTSRCQETYNCREVERRVQADFVRLKIPFVVVPQHQVVDKLLDLGAETYDSSIRERLAADFKADAVIELELLHAKTRVITVSGAEATVKIRIVRPTGEILLFGEGAGRALNTLSSPESVAQETFERILKKAFKK